jgi:hypothetical protein
LDFISFLFGRKMSLEFSILKQQAITRRLSRYQRDDGIVCPLSNKGIALSDQGFLKPFQIEK